MQKLDFFGAFQDTEPVKVVPGITDVGLDPEKAMVLLDGIYSTVVVRDILEREKRRGQKRITVSEDVRRRELAPLQKINDNYEKIVLSLDTGLDASYDGIKSLNLINWLIGKV